MLTPVNSRELEFPCSDLFPNRWSPRAMSGEEITEEELMRLFEAARWAPSCMNNQSWRFLYARRASPSWDRHFGLLKDANKVWCKNAAALIVIVAKKTFDTNPSQVPTYAFDTGAAWENLALQASINDLVCHGMAGFDYAAAKSFLRVPDEYEVLAMAAVGRPGKVEDLPEQLRGREMPSGRKKLGEIACEGSFWGD